MEITGQLKAKFDTQQVSDKFSKLKFVLTPEASSSYPQHISMQVTQEKCAILDQFSEGQELKVQINIKGREWIDKQGDKKYFVTIEAWRIEAVSTNF